MFRVFRCLCFLLFFPVVAAAEEPPVLEEIVIVAHPLSAEGLAQASDVLEGEELQRKVAVNIGETLGSQPGIRSSAFGSAVGRPVIHGLGGARVRVMEDRIDTMDVSVTSADHAVAVDPFVAQRVEVLKGPSALLYGSGAIGGVVDVHTGRIPHTLPEKLTGGIETRYDDNADGWATTGRLDGRVGDISWHIDGSFKDGDEYEIPGFTESARQIAAEEAEEAEHEEEGEEHEEEHEEPVRGHLPGSQYDSDAFAFGLSKVGDWGLVGISVSRMEAEYGLPGGHGHGHEEEHEGEEEEEEEHEDEHGAEEGTPLLELEQTRVDVELGLVDPMPGFTALNVRLGVNNYEHQEFEPDGAPGTLFENDAWELRGELLFERENWAGSIGLQGSMREFSAVGDEAFVPPVDTSDIGVFWVAERDFGAFSLETGLRLGRVEHDPSDQRSRDFSTYATSIGLVFADRNGWQFSVLADHATRAPVAEELFADGAHIVTNAYEQGDPTLDRETATGLSANANFVGERLSMGVTVYYTDFSDFIFERATGAEIDELPVFLFQQDDARFFGFDAELQMVLAAWDNGELKGTAQYDMVDAELDGSQDLPRIPPARYGAGLEVSHGPWRASLNYLRTTEQDDIALNELATSAYEDLRAYVGWSVPMGGGELTAFVSGKNLTDDEQRSHTSFIKDFAPQPGRTVQAGVRVTF